MWDILHAVPACKPKDGHGRQVEMREVCKKVAVSTQTDSYSVSSSEQQTTPTRPHASTTTTSASCPTSSMGTDQLSMLFFLADAEIETFKMCDFSQYYTPGALPFTSAYSYPGVAAHTFAVPPLRGFGTAGSQAAGAKCQTQGPDQRPEEEQGGELQRADSGNTPAKVIQRLQRACAAAGETTLKTSELNRQHQAGRTPERCNGAAGDPLLSSRRKTASEAHSTASKAPLSARYQPSFSAGGGPPQAQSAMLSARGMPNGQVPMLSARGLPPGHVAMLSARGPKPVSALNLSSARSKPVPALNLSATRPVPDVLLMSSARGLKPWSSFGPPSARSSFGTPDGSLMAMSSARGAKPVPPLNLAAARYASDGKEAAQLSARVSARVPFLNLAAARGAVDSPISDQKQSARGVPDGPQLARPSARGELDGPELTRFSTQGVPDGSQLARPSARGALDGPQVVRSCTRQAQDGPNAIKLSARGAPEGREHVKLSVRGTPAKMSARGTAGTREPVKLSARGAPEGPAAARPLVNGPIVMPSLNLGFAKVAAEAASQHAPQIPALAIPTLHLNLVDEPDVDASTPSAMRRASQIDQDKSARVAPKRTDVSATPLIEPVAVVEDAPKSYRKAFGATHTRVTDDVAKALAPSGPGGGGPIAPGPPDAAAKAMPPPRAGGGGPNVPGPLEANRGAPVPNINMTKLGRSLEAGGMRKSMPGSDNDLEWPPLTSRPQGEEQGDGAFQKKTAKKRRQKERRASMAQHLMTSADMKALESHYSTQYLDTEWSTNAVSAPMHRRPSVLQHITEQ
eukprot:gene17431-23734_t